MNPDLILVEDECTDHVWLAWVDQYGVEGAECERCGEIMGHE